MRQICNNTILGGKTTRCSSFLGTCFLVCLKTGKLCRFYNAKHSSHDFPKAPAPAPAPNRVQIGSKAITFVQNKQQPLQSNPLRKHKKNVKSFETNNSNYYLCPLNFKIKFKIGNNIINKYSQPSFIADFSDHRAINEL